MLKRISKMLKLIVEDSDYTRATVVESTEETDRPKKLILRGICAKAEQINKNKRKYHFDALKKEFDRFVEEDVKTGRAWADFEHPSDSEIKRERAAARITKVECDPERKIWLGEAIVMKSDPKFGIPGTPRGDLLASYIYYSDGKQMCGFSTRGCGEIDESTHFVEHYHLIVPDIVVTPSCGEYADGILESKEFMIDVHGQIVECAMNNYERMINSASHTYDLEKKREIYRNAFDTLLKGI